MKLAMKLPIAEDLVTSRFRCYQYGDTGQFSPVWGDEAQDDPAVVFAAPLPPTKQHCVS